ncbi:hypothetical protein SERLA73DRAFT_78125 [Serpula lacrymans var. lacrymans S7.3]|uniref:SGNH hydrolase-type esterase domain-containing protein n=2 Tax=Serpula lacrymans var. lacrymans TaxID=341189 RepID=F8QC87_SERL3|nr:uncharacterized protein SERLADRAFT_418412 [Serpula lacrymans var. lacrymans S7.9]EGN94206.1 hypothetical protein SERLA73DRAFT_78125 [Serpula lacrymans var. lacrymans S7.3]EGO19630.1 hypothetical protein SERLADRAFT_418412 [Serpula lacrymans var. lacrymans S7.9]
MLVWTITRDGSSEPFTVESGDMEPSRELVLFDANRIPDFSEGVYCIEVTLVDWASSLEVEAIIVDSESSLLPYSTADAILGPTPILLIGDSISCGYAVSKEDGGQPIPRGYLDAFPTIAQRLLSRYGGSPHILFETISYPGVTLVNPTAEEAEEGMAEGMLAKFFQVSPWDSALCSSHRNKPSVVMIALGTNDDALDVSTESFSASFNELIGRLFQLYESSLACVIFIEPFPDFTEGDDIEPSTLSSCIPAVFEQLRQRYEHVTFHSINISSGIERRHTMDGLHPNVKGHEVLGKNLADQLCIILKPVI